MKRMLVSALVAGFGAGLFAAALQFAFVQPVLLEAELYETGVKTHVAAVGGAEHDHAHPEPAAADAVAATEAIEVTEATEATEATGAGEAPHDHGAHDHDAPAAPVDWARNGLTLIFTALVYCGYALLMVAAIAFAESRGETVTARSGMLWGLAGFIALHFAPAVGLPPELPGMSAADLTDRQIWWVSTVVATGIGLWLVAFGKSPVAWGAAVLLLMAPHLIGAPYPEQLSGPVPPELGALFAGRTLGVGMAAWVVLGLALTTVWTWDRSGNPAAGRA